MAEKGFVSKSALTAIADAIRAKTETTESMLPSEMAALITAISTGFDLPESFCTEIEVVTYNNPSLAVRFNVPCSFSEVPFGCIAWSNISTNYTTSSKANHGHFLANVDQYQLSGCKNEHNYTKRQLYLEDGYIELYGAVGGGMVAGTWTILFWR